MIRKRYSYYLFCFFLLLFNACDNGNEGVTGTGENVDIQKKSGMQYDGSIRIVID